MNPSQATSPNPDDRASATLQPRPPQTRYVQMLLEQNKIPLQDNILANLFTWLLVADSILFSGTFTSWHNSSAIMYATDKSMVASAIYTSVQNIPLVVFATIFCVIGTSGVAWLWWKWRSNYMWLAQQIFRLLNSATGFINVLINIYTARSGVWSVTARVTAAITGFFTLLATGLFLYNIWRLIKVKRAHEAELEASDEKGLQTLGNGA